MASSLYFRKRVYEIEHSGDVCPEEDRMYRCGALSVSCVEEDYQSEDSESAVFFPHILIGLVDTCPEKPNPVRVIFY